MSRIKQWRVVLDAETPPACGDWFAANGLVPGSEETVRFTFLDGSRAEGFTFRNEVMVEGCMIPSPQLSDDVGDNEVPWLHFPDCMEVVGVERLHWQPKALPQGRPLWLLTVESLPSNHAFERRFFEEQDKRQSKLKWKWWLRS